MDSTIFFAKATRLVYQQVYQQQLQQQKVQPQKV